MKYYQKYQLLKDLPIGHKKVQERFLYVSNKKNKNEYI